MKIRDRKWLRRAVVIVGVILVLLAAFTVWQTFRRYILVEGKLYPRQDQMDLRGQQISMEVFDKLRSRSPHSSILWDVPFQDSVIPSDTQQLTVTDLTEQDVQSLRYFPQLQVLDGRNCDDIQLLAQAQQMYPHCQVLYTVSIGGTAYPQDTTRLELSGIAAGDVERMECLPLLQKVTVSDHSDFAFLQLLKEQYPQWDLTYLITLGGEKYAYDVQEITVRAATQKELQEGLAGFSGLRRLQLIDPEAEGECLRSLREQYPDTEICWELDIQGTVYTDDMTEVDISHMPLESLEQAEAIGSYFPQLEKLIVDSGSIDNDTMADFRERMRPDYKGVDGGMRYARVRYV